MKLTLMAGLLLVSFGSYAQSLEKAAEGLSQCLVNYSDSQVKTTDSAQEITDRALAQCRPELQLFRDSVGPDAAQWEKLDERQKQAINQLKDSTLVKLRTDLSAQIAAHITEASQPGEKTP